MNPMSLCEHPTFTSTHVITAQLKDDSGNVYFQDGYTRFHCTECGAEQYPDARTQKIIEDFNAIGERFGADAREREY